jgi:hypothetical protein
MPNRDFPLSPTPAFDSTRYFKKEIKNATNDFSNAFSSRDLSVASNRLAAANKGLKRQELKSKSIKKQ